VREPRGCFGEVCRNWIEVCSLKVECVHVGARRTRRERSMSWRSAQMCQTGVDVVKENVPLNTIMYIVTGNQKLRHGTCLVTQPNIVRRHKDIFWPVWLFFRRHLLIQNSGQQGCQIFLVATYQNR
jgi:hypothetical protein